MKLELFAFYPYMLKYQGIRPQASGISSESHNLRPMA